MLSRLGCHRFCRKYYATSSRCLLYQRCLRSHSTASLPEEVHAVAPEKDSLDRYLDNLVHDLPFQNYATISQIYRQYQEEAGTVIDRVVPYEEQPPALKRADAHLSSFDASQGDGLVMVAHVILNSSSMHLTKTTLCSGFVVNASLNHSHQGDTVVTCAHTLHEIHNHLNRANEAERSSQLSFSFIIPSSGKPRIVKKLLSSMPRSDAIVLEVQPTTPSPRLRPLPLSPYPVYTGTNVLTHLFGSREPPLVQHSIARTRRVSPKRQTSDIEIPIPWLEGHAWRRWGAGIMLGYRSYTGLELEAGISSVLPHILTSILPTSGSSGGPLVHAESGAVVGMTSGRRMDNRVEGERGWGCSAEKIFEMFSLPGFTPSVQHKHPYP